MKKLIATLGLITLLTLSLPQSVFAAGGISPGGGGSHVEGETFSVSVRASGATFNAFQGTISVSGPVTVVSVNAGSATWVKQPSNGGQFIGMITSATSSLTVATVNLKGTKPGTGTVSVSGVSLANGGSVVGTGGGSAGFTITKAPIVPKAVTVTSTSHPDQTIAYDATSVVLAWDKPAGVTGFSYIFDQVADTALGNKADSANTTITYENQKVGIYYFHIKAQNADGWGPATHFKVTIKEPDAKIQNGISKPSGITITKAGNFKNIIKDGTVSGIIIKGKMPSKAVMEKAIAAAPTPTTPISIESSTKELYQANILLDPEQLLPEGKKLSVTPDKDGNFKLLIDWPIKAGAYKLAVQGQRDKLLTPISNEITFEIQQHDGGKIILLSKSDEKEYIPTFWETHKRDAIVAGLTFGTILVLSLITFLIFILIKKILHRDKSKGISKTAMPMKKRSEKQTFKWD